MMLTNKEIKIGIVIGLTLLCEGLSSVLQNLGYSVNLLCKNRKDLNAKLDENDLPQVILMDIEMPLVDGYAATLWLKQNHPSIFILALIVKYDEDAIKKMIENGANGFILVGSHPDEIDKAIHTVMKKGVYYQKIDKGMQSLLSGKPYFKPW